MTHSVTQICVIHVGRSLTSVVLDSSEMFRSRNRNVECDDRMRLAAPRTLRAVPAFMKATHSAISRTPRAAVADVAANPSLVTRQGTKKVHWTA